MQEERFHERCRAYSAWHRTNSVRRFLEPGAARLLACVDLDMVMWCEHDPVTRQPLLLLECARDVGQQHKPTPVLTALAIRAGLPSYTVLYRLADKPNPADPSVPDIEAFRVLRTNPEPQAEWRTLTPEQWATTLLALRSRSWRLNQPAANDARYGVDPMPPAIATVGARKVGP
jgi:hypothetical protein